MIVIYTVTATQEEAERIGRIALEQRLCACVNLVPGMRSLYWWDGKIENAQECVLLLKTDAEHYAAVEELIRLEHSYQTPAIFSLPVDRVWPEYEAWLKNEVK